MIKFSNINFLKKIKKKKIIQKIKNSFEKIKEKISSDIFISKMSLIKYKFIKILFKLSAIKLGFFSYLVAYLGILVVNVTKKKEIKKIYLTVLNKYQIIPDFVEIFLLKNEQILRRCPYTDFKYLILNFIILSILIQFYLINPLYFYILSFIIFAYKSLFNNLISFSKRSNSIINTQSVFNNLGIKKKAKKNIHYICIRQMNMGKGTGKKAVEAGKYFVGAAIGALGNEGAKTVVDIAKIKKEEDQHNQNLAETQRHNSILEEDVKVRKESNDLYKEDLELRRTNSKIIKNENKMLRETVIDLDQKNKELTKENEELKKKK